MPGRRVLPAAVSHGAISMGTGTGTGMGAGTRTVHGKCTCSVPGEQAEAALSPLTPAFSVLPATWKPCFPSQGRVAHSPSEKALFLEARGHPDSREGMFVGKRQV